MLSASKPDEHCECTAPASLPYAHRCLAGIAPPGKEALFLCSAPALLVALQRLHVLDHRNNGQEQRRKGVAFAATAGVSKEPQLLPQSVLTSGLLSGPASCHLPTL